MTPDSIQGLYIQPELVRSVLRGEQRPVDDRRLRVLAALADIERRREEQQVGDRIGEAA